MLKHLIACLIAYVSFSSILFAQGDFYLRKENSRKIVEVPDKVRIGITLNGEKNSFDGWDYSWNTNQEFESKLSYIFRIDSNKNFYYFNTEKVNTSNFDIIIKPASSRNNVAYIKAYQDSGYYVQYNFNLNNKEYLKFIRPKEHHLKKCNIDDIASITFAIDDQKFEPGFAYSGTAVSAVIAFLSGFATVGESAYNPTIAGIAGIGVIGVGIFEYKSKNKRKVKTYNSNEWIFETY
jgi:hypothetical protein